MSLLRNRKDEEHSSSLPRELFSFEVRRDGRAVALLRGIRSIDGVVVETEVFPVTEHDGPRGIRRPFPFATVDQAQRFTDEALMALEYLNCSVV